MRNKVLNLVSAISIAGYASLPCLANEAQSEASSESSHESGVGIAVHNGATPATEANKALQQSNLPKDAKDVNVVSKDGAVEITGTVKSASEKAKINSVIENTGATNVRNELKVEGSTGSAKKATTASKGKFYYPPR